jgi:hypothetical protein
MAKKAAGGVNRSQEIRDYLAQNPQATPTQIVSALAERGIEVAEGLASVVKSEMRRKAAAGTGASAGNGRRKKVWKRPRKAGRMAVARASRTGETGEVSRSQKVRDYLAAHPDATPKTVVTALAEQGVEVSSGLVASIKYGKPRTRGRVVKRKKRRPVAARRAPVAAARTTASRSRGSTQLTAQDLFETKRLVDQLGGIEKARRAIAVLEELQ